MTYRPGTVLKVSRDYDKPPYMLEGEHYAVSMGDDDVMIFTKHDSGWNSRVCSLGEGDEVREIKDEEVPADIPADFWPLVARLQLTGE